MSATSVSFKIGADNTEALEKLKQLQSAFVGVRTGLKDTGVTAAGTAKDTDALQNKLGGLNTKLKDTKQQADNASSGAAGLSKSFASLKGHVIGLVAAYASLASVKTLTKLADDYRQLASRIEIATESVEEYEFVQNRITEIANNTYRSRTEAAEGYLAVSGTLKDLGFNTAEALDIVESLSLGFVINATDVQFAQTAVDQYSKSMIQNKVTSDAWLAITRASPKIINDLAESTGKTAAEIKKLGVEGKISINDLNQALLKTRDANVELAGVMATSATDGAQQLENKIGVVVGKLNEKYNITQKVADGLVGLGNAIEGLMPVFDALVGAIGELGGIAKDVFSFIGELWSDLTSSVSDDTQKQVFSLELLVNMVKVVHVAFIGLRTGIQLIMALIKAVVQDAVASIIATFIGFRTGINVAVIAVSGYVESLITLLQTLAQVAMKALTLDFSGAIGAWEAGTEKIAGIVKSKASAIANETERLKNDLSAAAETSGTLNGSLANKAGQISQKGQDDINKVLLKDASTPKIGGYDPGKGGNGGSGATVDADKAKKAKQAADKARREAQQLAEAQLDHAKKQLDVELSNIKQRYDNEEISFSEYIGKKTEINERVHQLDMAHIEQQLATATGNEQKLLAIKKANLKIEQNARVDAIAQEGLVYAKELEKRKKAILDSIADNQSKIDGFAQTNTQKASIENQKHFKKAREEVDELRKKLGEKTAIHVELADGSVIQINRDIIDGLQAELDKQQITIDARIELTGRQETLQKDIAKIISDKDYYDKYNQIQADRNPMQREQFEEANRQNALAALDALRGKMQELQQIQADMAAQPSLYNAEKLQETNELIQELTLTMGELEIAAQTPLEKFGLDLQKTAIQASESGLSNFFMDMVNGTKSVKDGLKDMARSFVQAITQMVAKALAAYAMIAFLNFIPGGAAVLSTMDAAARIPSFGKKHTGGIVDGKNQNVKIDENFRLKSNEIPTILEEGEEVLTANNPRHRKNLTADSHLSRLFADLPRYHSGGIAGMPADSALMQTVNSIDVNPMAGQNGNQTASNNPVIQIHNIIKKEDILDIIGSPEGQKVFINEVFAQNTMAIRQGLES